MDKNEDLLLGVDVGTHVAKCVLVNQEGETLSSASEENSVEQPEPSWAQSGRKSGKKREERSGSSLEQ